MPFLHVWKGNLYGLMALKVGHKFTLGEHYGDHNHQDLLKKYCNRNGRRIAIKWKAYCDTNARSMKYFHFLSAKCYVAPIGAFFCTSVSPINGH